MNTTAHLARPIGILFLLAMVASIAGNATLLPVIAADDFLTSIAQGQTEVRIHALCMLFNSGAVIGLGVLGYAVLRAHSQLSATAYALARTVESIVLIFGVISVLSLLSVGDQYMSLQGGDAAYLLALGKNATANNWYAYHSAMIALGIGSLPFVFALLKLQLVPKYLAVLGLTGYAVLATSSILAIAGIDLGLIVTLPVFLFEVGLGFYLIVKGFKPAV